MVVGSTGGIGRALLEALEAQGTFDGVIGLSRRTIPRVDVIDEARLFQPPPILLQAGGRQG